MGRGTRIKHTSPEQETLMENKMAAVTRTRGTRQNHRVYKHQTDVRQETVLSLLQLIKNQTSVYLTHFCSFIIHTRPKESVHVSAVPRHVSVSRSDIWRRPESPHVVFPTSSPPVLPSVSAANCCGSVSAARLRTWSRSGGTDRPGAREDGEPEDEEKKRFTGIKKKKKKKKIKERKRQLNGVVLSVFAALLLLSLQERRSIPLSTVYSPRLCCSALCGFPLLQETVDAVEL
ncbi:unnamed protein product [Pleuronectes platessa]|uniref:Uncharacterized protein n=1 Tax=Pleuronectes platessa TaxID=8262 RepID=A0A9N7TRE5_PLEPL|nr:unnamed protein product [Pleuronectes platessa]